MIKSSLYNYGSKGRTRRFAKQGIRSLKFEHLEHRLALATCTGTVCVVTNMNDSGTGSLREAIDEANASLDDPSTFSITFDANALGPGTHKLTPDTPLTIKHSVIIDATGVPGRKIVIDGTSTMPDNDPYPDGLIYLRDIHNSTVKGLVIEGFFGSGVVVLSGSNNSILSSTIQDNGVHGVLVANSSGTRVGGPGEGNQISRNAEAGVQITAVTSNNQIIESNTISGNSGGVVFVNVRDSTIRGNTITESTRSGISFQKASTTNNYVTSNYIGTNANRATGLGNEDGIVLIRGATGNTIGGVGKENLIAGNQTGVIVSGSDTRRNTIQYNEFFGNSVLPIDVGPAGPNPNDRGDRDNGANSLLNRPEEVRLFQTGGNGKSMFRSILQYGSRTSFPVTLDFYKSADAEGTDLSYLDSYRCDPSDLQSACQLDEATGLLEVLVGEMDNIPLGFSGYVVAMATDNLGNSSEFSGVTKVRTTILPDSVDATQSESIELIATSRTVTDLANSNTYPNGKIWIGNDTDTFNIHTFGDQDYFSVTIKAENGEPLSYGTLVVELTSDSSQGNLDLEVINTTRNTTFESTGATGTERIAFPIIAEQQNFSDSTFIVVVKGYLGDISDDYQLTVRFQNVDDDADALPREWEAPEDGSLPGIVYLDTETQQDKKVLFETPPNPEKRDLYVEIDSMVGQEPRLLDDSLKQFIRGDDRFRTLAIYLDEIENGDLEAAALQPTGTVLDLVVAAFLRAPVANVKTDDNPEPDMGIQLHLEKSDVVPMDMGFLDRVDPEPRAFASWNEFLQVRDRYFGTTKAEQDDWSSGTGGDPPGRSDAVLAKKNGYRYAFFGYALEDRGEFGRASIKSNDIAITLKTPDELDIDLNMYALYQAGVFMHEIGHTLGLTHGEDVNYDKEYLSVMNYLSVVPSGVSGDDWPLDYSNVGDLDSKFNDWGNLQFQYAYADLIDQGSVTDGQPCARLSDSTSDRPLPDWNEPLKDWIDLRGLFPDQFPDIDSPFDCFYLGTDKDYEIAMPFVGDVDLAISLPSDDGTPLGVSELLLNFDELPDLDQEITINQAEPFRHRFSFGKDSLPLLFSLFPSDGSRNGQSTIVDISFTFVDAAHAENIDTLRSVAREGINTTPGLDEKKGFDESDVAFFVESILGTSAGDANLDGAFDSADLIEVFAAGKYEASDADRAATWQEGDWDGDGLFTSSDLISGLSTGRYNNSANSVPEQPTSPLREVASAKRVDEARLFGPLRPVDVALVRILDDGLLEIDEWLWTRRPKSSGAMLP